MLPAWLPAEVPVAMDTLPEGPAAAVPDFSETDPLAPALPAAAAAAVAKRRLPLEEASP
jgi:hypothetical protein